jgi:hypothetical protein
VCATEFVGYVLHQNASADGDTMEYDACATNEMAKPYRLWKVAGVLEVKKFGGNLVPQFMVSANLDRTLDLHTVADSATRVSECEMLDGQIRQTCASDHRLARETRMLPCPLKFIVDEQ